MCEVGRGLQVPHAYSENDWSGIAEESGFIDDENRRAREYDHCLRDLRRQATRSGKRFCWQRARDGPQRPATGKRGDVPSLDVSSTIMCLVDD